ncbi:sulfotransferase family protein [Neptuniibacter marinus]|uniref:sulfotransferase family protein n=1 Tax=Neptuniibacter marinus TaxID=1806670 RepID=UPI003B59BCF9
MKLINKGIFKQFKLWLLLNPRLQPLLYKTRYLIQVAFSEDCFCENTEQSKRFLFIVGCGRSGNTLLRRLLMERFDIYIPPESYVLPRQINQYLVSGHLKWVEKVDVILSFIENHPEFNTFGVKSLRGFKKEAKEWKSSEQTYLNLIVGLYQWLAINNNCDSLWVGDKTPLNTLNLGLLNKAFPNAKFIFLERDPVDVIQSYLASGIYDNAIDASLRWQRSLTAWLRFKKIKHKSDLIELQYERLVTNHDSVLEEIGKQFLLPERDRGKGFELSSLGDVLSRSHHSNVKNAPSTGSIGKGRVTIKEGDLKSARKVLGKLPQKRGYSSL